MTKIRFRWWSFLFVLASLSAGTSVAAGHVWPPIATEGDRLRLIVYLHRHWPQLFTEEMHWDADAFEQLEKQFHLHEDLAGNPLYAKLSQEKGEDLAEVQIEIFSLARKVRDDEAKLARIAMIRALETVDATAGESALLGKIASLVRPDDGRQLLAELAEFIDRAERGAFFTMSASERYERLRSILPDGNISLKKRTVTREQILRELGPSEEDGVLRALVESHLLLQDAEGKVPGIRSDWITRLRTEDLGLFLDKQEIAVRTEKMYVRMKGENYRRKEAFADLKALVQTVETHGRMISEKSATGPAIDSITLRETPPELGFLKGSLGNDCALLTCAAYVDAPEARTFYLFDRRNEPSGYAITWDTMTHGQKSAYLGGLLSADLSPESVEPVVHALQAIAAKRGRVPFLLPEESQVVPLHIDWHIQRVIRDLKEGKTQTEVRFPGETLFPHYEDYAYSKDYAAPAKNSVGHIYAPVPDPERQVKMSIGGWKLPVFDVTTISDVEVGLIAAKWRVARRPLSIGRLYAAAGVSAARQREMEALFLNEAQVPVRAYFRSVSDELARGGILISPDALRTQDWNFLRIGALRSSDAFDVAHVGNSLKHVVALARKRQDLSSLRGILRTHAEAIETNAEFGEVLGGLLRDSKIFASLAVLQDLINGHIGIHAVVDKWATKLKNHEGIFRVVIDDAGAIQFKVWDEPALHNLPLGERPAEIRELLSALEGRSDLREIRHALVEILATPSVRCREANSPAPPDTH